MLTGHFGVSYALKAKEQHASLGLLLPCIWCQHCLPNGCPGREALSLQAPQDKSGLSPNLE